MFEDIAHYEGRLAKVCGPARSGKTEALLSRCVALVEDGIAPNSILVEVSSALSAQAFRGRLRAVMGQKEDADKVRIATAKELCVEVLSREDALAATGRRPRLLSSAEYNFFLEDMKTLGQPVRRLRKMLEFFYARWSLLEEERDWLEPGEESKARAHAAKLLEGYGAMLSQEAAYVCAHFLNSDAGASARGSYAYVLCDDYQNLSHAEQTCLCLLAGKQLIVAGNPNQEVSKRGEHPYARGFVEFETLRRNVQVFELAQTYGASEVAAFSNALCAHGSMNGEILSKEPGAVACSHGEINEDGASSALPDAPAVMCVKWSTPEDELNGLTKYIRALADEEGEGSEGGMCIVVPNRRWARIVQRMLEKRGFMASCAPVAGGIGGDPRELDRAHALIARTKLALLANEHDGVAWRCWCGFGNHLTNSDAWGGLVSYAAQKGLSPLETLSALGDVIQKLGSEPFSRASVLAERYKSGRAFIEKNASRKGFALLRALGAEDLFEFLDVSALMEGDESAEQVEKLMRAWESDPVFPDDPRVIRIASYESMTGIEADWVFAIAAVDGFVPVRDAFEVVSTEEDRNALTNEQRRLFYNAVSKARKHLVISYFAKAALELAEQSKMQVVRVRAEEQGPSGQEGPKGFASSRIAVVRPSMFLAEAGDACPGSIGGQALLAQLGLN